MHSEAASLRSVRNLVRFLPALRPISTKLICLPMGKRLTSRLLQMEGHMHTRAHRSQFEIKGAAVVHTPTGAEFIPQVGDSVIVWTGDIGQKCRAETCIGTMTYLM